MARPQKPYFAKWLDDHVSGLCRQPDGRWRIWPQYRWVAVAQIPYLIWVSIATVLPISITLRNRRRCHGLLASTGHLGDNQALGESA